MKRLYLVLAIVDAILPYFLKMMNNTDPQQQINSRIC